MSERFRFSTKAWEGVYADDFTLDQVRRRCFRLGEALVAQGWSCLIAYDTRFMSNLFARDIYRSLAVQGVPVSVVSTPVPMPAVQAALEAKQANCALIVSARNRPYWYNGLVLVSPDNASLTLDLGDSVTLPQPFPPSLETEAKGQQPTAEATHDLRGAYIEALRKRVDTDMVRRATLTIFVDPMNGTTSGYFPAVLGEGGQTRAIEINRETDPLFSKLTPLPSGSDLTRLRKLVRESDSHLGLAFSADGVALGMVDKNGEQLEQIEIVLLLAAYLVRQYRQRGLVIVPPPRPGSRFEGTLSGLSEWEDALGLKAELTSDATNRIAEMMSQSKNQLLIGGTPEGEILLGRHGSYPDALFAGLLMAELVSRNTGNLQAMLDELRGRLGVPT